MDKTLAHLASTPPAQGNFGDHTPRLFHYTTYPGFLGIVQTRNLWATNIHYLNDFEEFKHGLEIGRRVVKRKLRTASGSTRALLERLETVGEQFRRVNIFVSSFTEEGDILSQWRGYSSTVITQGLARTGIR